MYISIFFSILSLHKDMIQTTFYIEFLFYLEVGSVSSAIRLGVQSVQPFNDSASIKIERTNSIPQTILQLTPRALAIAPNAALPSRGSEPVRSIDWRQRGTTQRRKKPAAAPKSRALSLAAAGLRGPRRSPAAARAAGLRGPRRSPAAARVAALRRSGGLALRSSPGAAPLSGGRARRSSPGAARVAALRAPLALPLCIPRLPSVESTRRP
jgi:hypothetical protein